jgi:hypothetical protein
MQSRGLSAGSADDAVLHTCRNPRAQEAMLDMCRLENMLACVRMSFLAQALALPLTQLRTFLIKKDGNLQPCEDPHVWLARDVTITSVQASMSIVHNRWKSITAAAAAAKTIACLWQQRWRLLWQQAGMTPQLHVITGTRTSEADMEAAHAFERRFSEWAVASCRSLWKPATGYCACLKMVEKALESICCMMEVPMLQKSVYSRIGGERMLEVVAPHRRHLKILQLWMQVPRL